MTIKSIDEVTDESLLYKIQVLKEKMTMDKNEKFGLYMDESYPNNQKTCNNIIFKSVFLSWSNLCFIKSSLFYEYMSPQFRKKCDFIFVCKHDVLSNTAKIYQELGQRFEDSNAFQKTINKIISNEAARFVVFKMNSRRMNESIFWC